MIEDAAPVADSAPVTPEAAPATEKPILNARDAFEAVKARNEEREATRAPKPTEGRNPNAPKPDAAPAPKAAMDDRPRGPDGKFVPAVDRPAPDATKAAPSGEPSPPSAQIAPDAGGGEKPEAAAHRPPPSWSPSAKVAFDSLPDTVKAEISKRETEVAQGFAKLAEYKPVDKYIEMAKRSGTSLDRALENYVGIEQLLRRDPFAGVEQVLRNVGIDPQSFVTAYTHRLSQGNRTPDPQAATVANRTAPIDPQSIVRQATEAVRAEYEARQVQTELERFASDPRNRFYENVRPTMAKLVQAGLAGDLQTAYDMACKMDPEISRLTSQPAPDPRAVAAQQARSAAKATVGAPSAGVANKPPGLNVPQNANPRAIAAAALAAQRGARA